MNEFDLVIRTAVAADLEALRHVYRAASLSNAGDAPLLLARPEYLVFAGDGIAEGRTIVAESGGRVVGFAGVVDGTELEDLFVDPEWRRRGIARRLVQRIGVLTRAAGHRRLWVTGNPHALEFYLAAGFVTVEEVGTALGSGLRMVLELGLFCGVDLAGRIERAETGFIAACSRAADRRTGKSVGFVLPVAGGMASFAEPDSPFNKVVGLGFEGVPEAAELNKVERAYAACGSPVQVELANLADPEVGVFLTERGYRLVSFENVLGRAPGESVAVSGIEVRPSDDAEFPDWLDVVVEATLHEDTQGVPWHEEFPRHILENAEHDAAAAGSIRYAALRDGVIAGGASMHLSDGIAQLTGAATAVAHRRRGVQSALTAARLADAARAGCDLAVVTTQPGSKSQQNVQRQGFELLYTRAILVKELPRPDSNREPSH